MDSRSNDEDPDMKLDIEFRKILRIIKSYIPHIMNISYLTSYRMWLEKLSEADSSEKEERNRYLRELCHQIQDGVLKIPFTQLPALGPLVPYTDILKINKKIPREQNYLAPDVTFVEHPTGESGKQKATSYAQKTVPEIEQQNQEQIQFGNYLNNLSKHSNNLSRNDNHIEEQNKTNLGTQRPTTAHKKRIHRPTIKNETITTNSFDLQQPLIQKTDQYHTNQMQDQQQQINNSNYLQHEQQYNISYYQQLPEESRSVAYYEAVPHDSESLYLAISENVPSVPQRLPRNTPQQKNYDQGDDSSWCDLSEMSKTISKLESENSARSSESPQIEGVPRNITRKVCDNTLKDLMNIILELKKHNLTLSAKAEIVICNLSEEIRLLKNKVQKFGDVNMAIKQYKQITDSSSHWQAMVETLDKQLYDAQNHNKVLKNEVTSLQQNLEKFSVQKQKELAVIRQRLSELYNKEIEMLKQNYVKQIVGIENKFANMLIEKESIFNQKLNDLKHIYEKKTFNTSRGVFR